MWLGRNRQCGRKDRPERVGSDAASRARIELEGVGEGQEGERRPVGRDVERRDAPPPFGEERRIGPRAAANLDEGRPGRERREQLAAVHRTGDLHLHDLKEFGLSYARTLAAWKRRFNEALDRVRGLGFDERLIRKWNYYLSYCEAGFQERYLGDVQMVFSKPLWRGEPLLPSLS